MNKSKGVEAVLSRYLVSGTAHGFRGCLGLLAD